MKVYFCQIQHEETEEISYHWISPATYEKLDQQHRLDLEAAYTIFRRAFTARCDQEGRAHVWTQREETLG